LTVHRGTELRLRPCIPADWPGVRIRYRLPDHATTYDISVENGAVRSEATMDDAALTVRDRAVVIPVHLDGRTHRVHVRLGSDGGPRYEPRPAWASAPPLRRMISVWYLALVLGVRFCVSKSTWTMPKRGP